MELVESSEKWSERAAGAAQVGLAVALCLLVASAAAASPSVELVFTHLNGSSVNPTSSLGVLPGDEIGVEMVVSTDDRGLRAYEVWLDYDLSSGGLELSGGAAIAPPPLGPTLDWITQDPLPTQPGRVAYAGLSPIALMMDPVPELDAVVQDATFAIGWATLQVTEAILNGPATLHPDLTIVLGTEWLSDISGDFEEIDLTAEYAFNSLSLFVIPEPGTGLLVGFGLIALGLRGPAGGSGRSRSRA